MEARVPKTPDEWARALRRNTIRIDGPWDQLGRARRAWITLRCWARRMQGYAVHHTSGGVYFDGPFANLKPRPRLWLAIYAPMMRRRGYTFTYTRSGYYFDRAFSSRDRAPRTQDKVAS